MELPRETRTDLTAARGATGPGPLRAEGGGRAGPRRPAAVRARLRRAPEDEFLGIPVSWRVAECGCAAGGRRSLGRRWPRGGGRDTPERGPCGRPRPRGPARPARARPFVRIPSTRRTLLESLNGNGALLPLQSCAAESGAGSRDLARKKTNKQTRTNMFGAGMEAGLKRSSHLAAGRRRGSPSVPASWFTCCSAPRPPLPCLL